MIDLRDGIWSKRGADYAESAPHRSGPSLPKLLALARPVAEDVCLDIGTGTGHTAAQVAKYASRVYGLDPAEGMLEAAREAYGELEGVAFVSGTSEETGFPNETFDLVTARHTLHHHPNLPKTLLEIRRVLKRGGRLVLVDEVTPHAEVAAWFHELETTRDPTHVRASSMEEWRESIREAGLEWVVGDAETTYWLEVASWIGRMKPTPEGAEKVRELFREASPSARETFNIMYRGGEAVSFDMPMALILAVELGGEARGNPL